MHTFAQKPKATRQTMSAMHARPIQTHSGHNREAHSILHLQPTIGNQAVQPLPLSSAETLESGSVVTASTCFTHDFSRIPLRATTRAGIQPKLAISTPGDIFEQEADNVAEHVMRMPDSGNLEGIKGPGDGYEENAEHISERVMRITEMYVQRQVGLEEDELERLEEVSERLREQELEARQEPELERWEKEELERLEEEENKRRGQRLQRKSADAQSPSLHGDLEPQVQPVRSKGQQLPVSTRRFFEPRFGYDFSQVRIHTDKRASQSAGAVNALAYTVGQDVVFGKGQFAPNTTTGQRLLAHELTHVIQQSGPQLQRLHPFHLVGIMMRPEQLRKRDPFKQGERKIKVHPSGQIIMRLARHAMDIISVAQDSSRAIDVRAVEVVRRIIDQYYPGDSAKVRAVAYNQPVSGLEVDASSFLPRSGGASATANILVGEYFVEHTDTRHFARRVQQVRHELDHIDQVRAGMGDPSRPSDFSARLDEREFLAHYRGAIHFTPPAGTGRIPHGTIVAIIDAAIGHYYCMNGAKQTQYQTELRQLLARRPER